MPRPIDEAADDLGCRSLRWSLALLSGLSQGGVARLVLSPGSRSTPVVLAAQRLPALDTTVILDERSAAFYALGLARASRRPVALLCTSGSAPGHWLPAVIEASEWGDPLILLTADRPPELHGWGASQTVNQTRFFGPFVREFHDPGPPQAGAAALKTMRALGRRAAAVAAGQRPGPVHINLPYPEPLVPSACCDGIADGLHGPGAPAPGPRLRHVLDISPDGLQPVLRGRGLICCGPGDLRACAAHIWGCAQRLHLPVLCDPLSGLRFGADGRGCIARYDAFLRNPTVAGALRPDWVLRFGAAPVSRTLTDWLRGVPALLVGLAGRWADPGHDAVTQLEVEPGAFCRWLSEAGLVQPDSDWAAAWDAVELKTAALAKEHLSTAPWCEAHLIRDLVSTLPAGDGLLCANSLPIRQLDAWSGTRVAPLAVFGNRGASGIDGQASTLAGLNAAGVAVTGLLGDLSLLHDLSGLFLARGLTRPMVVLNNGGGRVFDYLPQHGLPGFERFWRTPIDVDLAELTRPFRLTYIPVSDGAGFRRVLGQALGTPRPTLIEVMIDPEASRAAHLGYWQRVADADLLRPR